MQPRGEVAPWDEPLPPLPAGFQLERQPLSDAEVMQPPPLPEGFQLERPPPPSSSGGNSPMTR
jgi:hypothetical protein